MLAAERGAAANTLAAYRRDLAGAGEHIADLATATRDDLARLGAAWSDLAPSSLARKCSALRQFYGFLVDEGLRTDDPSPALPRPRARRPLPRLLDHAEIARLFAAAEDEAAAETPAAVRMLTLLELLYLQTEAAQAMNLPAVNYDETQFRFALNEDAMATEKLAEGIRAFCADAIKLEQLLLAA